MLQTKNQHLSSQTMLTRKGNHLHTKRINYNWSVRRSHFFSRNVQISFKALVLGF
jgi:hypothetical protein